MNMHPALYVFVVAVIFGVLQVVYKSMFVKPSNAPSVLRQTIFVTIIVPPGIADMSKQIHRLFAFASEPSRVFLGIYDFSNCIHHVYDLQNNIRKQNMSLEKFYRLSTARAQVMKNLYFGEMYVLFIPYNCEPDHDWDSKLIDMFDNIEHPQNKIYTSMCNTTSVNRSTLPGFLCLKQLKRASLELKSVSVPDALTDETPSTFWSSHFSFSFGSVFQEVPLIEDMSDTMESTIQSLRLWTHGYNFVVPSCNIFWVDKIERERPSSYSSKPLLGHLRTMSEYFAYSGVNLKTGKATAKSYCGLTLKCTVSECTNKYGSLELAKLEIYEKMSMVRNK